MNYLEIPRIFLFILGSIIGSFTGVLYAREGKESILFPPSHCDSCKTPLKWFELIPVFSYILLKGKCRYCKKKIPIIYLIIEFVNGLFYSIIGFREYFIFIDLTFSLLFILSLLDLKYLEVSTRLLLLFFLVRLSYMIWSKNFSFFFLIFLFIIIIQKVRKEEKLIGQGDLYLLLSLSLDKGEYFLIFLLILGFVSGVFAFYYLLRKKRTIAFIPIITTAFVLSIFLKTPLMNYYFS